MIVKDALLSLKNLTTFAKIDISKEERKKNA